MAIPIERIDLNHIEIDGRHDLIITAGKKVIRMILDDFWKQFNDDFKVDLYKGRYYLHLINTALHGFWCEIPDDTIAYCIKTYYTLHYPHHNERIMKRKNEIVFMLIDIDKAGGEDNELLEKEQSVG